MKAIGVFTLVAMLLTMTGCALTSKAERDGLFNPPGIHPSTAVKADQETPGQFVPGQIPVTRYYEALKTAQSSERDRAAITDFVDKGIGLTSAYCLRWFRKLDDVQRKLDLQEREFNVIRDLGTALLGIGGASSAWVAGYGAVNTAYSGVIANFNEAVLAGPTTAKIKSQVLDMLRTSENALRVDALRDGFTFTQAYSRLELHADTCTHNTVRNLLDTTLATQTDRDPETGVIRVVSLQPATPDQVRDVRTINSAVAGLIKDSTKLDEINRVLKAVGATRSDFSNFPDAAKALEQQFRSMAPADTQKWRTALGM